MSESNHPLHRWFEEVWNQGRESAIDEQFAQGCVAHGLGESDITVHGPDEFKQFWRNIRAALPDVRIEVQDLVSDGHKAAARVVLTGTHTGEGLGAPPSGNRVRIAGIVMVHIQNGQIVEGWNSWDQLGLLRQIGVVPTEKQVADRFLRRA